MIVERLTKQQDFTNQELKLQLVAETVQNIRISQLLNEEPITEKSTYGDIINTLPML